MLRSINHSLVSLGNLLWKGLSNDTLSCAVFGRDGIFDGKIKLLATDVVGRLSVNWAFRGADT